MKKCWQFSNDSLAQIPPAANLERVVMALSDGSILALNASDGQTAWRSDLGGEIVGQTLIGANDVFVASQAVAAHEKEISSIVLRALSLATGVTVWQSELEKVSKFSFTLPGNVVLTAANYVDNGLIITAFNTQSGEKIWTKNLPNVSSSQLIVSENKVYFVTNENILQILSLIDGGEVRRIFLPHPAMGPIAVSNGTVIFTELTGKVSVLREVDRKILWSIRFGGAVQHILPTTDGVILSSLDNFVYFHTLNNGKRRWRKRLGSRPLGANLLFDKTALLMAAGENTGVIVNLKKGKTINQISFGAETSAIATPLFIDNRLFIATNRGLQSFAQNSVNCPLQ